jgi:hypothetical protein
MSAFSKKSRTRQKLYALCKLKAASEAVNEHKKNFNYEGNIPSTNTILKGMYKLQSGAGNFKTKSEWRREGFEVLSIESPFVLWDKPQRIGGRTHWAIKYVYNEKQVRKAI